MSHRNDSVYDPARQCIGKLGYSSKAKAKRHGRRAEGTIGRLFAYRCPHCSLFHLGHRR
jgi:hypothetical protein